jgi:hypothetical protein
MAVSNLFSIIPGDIRIRGAPPVSLTPGAMEKIFNQKSFKHLVWTPLCIRGLEY